MNNQLSGEVLVALLTRIAISGLMAARQLSNAESVLRVTPSFCAAAVTVRLSGFMTSSRRIFPGCVGFLLVSKKYLHLLMIVLIIYINGILAFKLKSNTPFPANPYRPGVFITAF